MPGVLYAVIVVVFVIVAVVYVRRTQRGAFVDRLPVAEGERVILEEEPELLTSFYKRLMLGDCDVVYGVQEARRGGLVERVTGEIFFSLVNALSDQKMPRNPVVARLMTRDYIRSLIRHLDQITGT